MARYSFLTTDGPDEGRSFELNTGITLIGRRDSPADDDPEGSHRWILTDPAVSRTHARIEWDGKSSPVLVHLSSTNATLLDGRIVTGQSIEDGQSLGDGQKLRMGQTGFEVIEEADSGRWFVLERDRGDAEQCLEPGEGLDIAGIALHCEGAVVEARLLDKNVEAYILREIDGKYWTTALRHSESINLCPHDVIRTESKKLVLVDRES